MNRKPALQFIVLSLVMSFILAGCNLPTITPPPDYAPTEAPTLTATAEPTLPPVTATPALHATVITATNQAQLAPVTKAPASNVQTLNWSGDSSILGVISQNQDASGNTIYSASLLDGNTLAVKTVWAAPEGGRIVQIGPDGRLAAVISADMRTATMYDLGDGDKDVVEITPQYTIGGVTFSPDGKYFTITDMDDMLVSLHNLLTVSDMKVYNGFQTAAPVFEVGFAGNSSTLVWKARASIQLQDVVSGAMGAAFSGEDFFGAYRLSADGKVLAGAADKTISGNFVPAVTLWDTVSGNELHTLVLTQPAQSLSFSPDGALLAVAAGNDVQIWDVTSGTQLVTLSGHSAEVMVVAFSPDGKTLASSGQDNQLILWQVLQ